jgi:hypothetical protein
LWSLADQSLSDQERMRIDKETFELIEIYRNEISEASHYYKNICKSNENRMENCKQVILFLESFVDSLQSLLQQQQSQIRQQFNSRGDYTKKSARSKKRGLNLNANKELNKDNKMVTSLSIKQELSKEQQQEYMMENENLLGRLETWSSQINEVHKQIIFLSEATSIMAGHVEKQAETIDNILVQAEEARDSFGRGNYNIQSAKATSSDFRLCTIVLLIFLSFSLLFLHWIH